MALNQTTLENNIRALIDPTYDGFIGYPSTKAAGIANWANAYDGYALSAVDLSGDSVVTTNKAGFISELTTYMPDPLTGSPEDAAEAFEKAFTAYWTAATFAVGIPPTPTGPCPNIGGNLIFGIETSSVVSSITPNVLKNLLIVEFGIFSADGAQKAADIASCLHTTTTTAVFVTITGTDTTTPTPLPITNTCVIH